jgi:hypothetical protein
MPFAIDKILLSLGFVLLLTLFIGTRAGLAMDAAYPDRFLVSIRSSHIDFIVY